MSAAVSIPFDSLFSEISMENDKLLLGNMSKSGSHSRWAFPAKWTWSQCHTVEEEKVSHDSLRVPLVAVI